MFAEGACNVVPLTDSVRPLLRAATYSSKLPIRLNEPLACSANRGVDASQPARMSVDVIASSSHLAIYPTYGSTVLCDAFAAASTDFMVQRWVWVPEACLCTHEPDTGDGSGESVCIYSTHFHSHFESCRSMRNKFDKVVRYKSLPAVLKIQY